jgi:fatty acid desaturase
MWAGFYRSRPDRPAQASRSPWTARIRQFHRTLAIVFTLLVIANFAVRALGEAPLWLTYSPLPPLFLLIFSGLTIFALPSVAHRRARATAR